jgi:hypothetical protein
MGACERGPNIRVCTGALGGRGGPKTYEVNAVSDLAKVASVLRDLLNLPVSDLAVATLEANLAGNQCLQRNEISLALEAYDRALSLGYQPQRGVLLSMRAEAYLLRAFSHRKALEKIGRFPPPLDFVPLLGQEGSAPGVGSSGGGGGTGGGGGSATAAAETAAAAEAVSGWHARFSGVLAWLPNLALGRPATVDPATGTGATAASAGTASTGFASVETAPVSEAAADLERASRAAGTQVGRFALRKRLLGWWRGDNRAKADEPPAMAAAVPPLAASGERSPGGASAGTVAAFASTAGASTAGLPAFSAAASAAEASRVEREVVFHARLYRRALLKWASHPPSPSCTPPPLPHPRACALEP